MRYLLLLTSILCLSVLPCFGQISAMNMTKAQFEKATLRAQKSLAELSQLAQQIDVKTLGFDNQEQVRQAKVGTPVADYMVRLDELKKYQTGQPIAQLVHATGRLIYPLEVNRDAKSSVVLVLDKGEWGVESFGAAKQIKMVTDLRKTIARAEGRAETDLFQVRVPALQLLFVGIERSGKLYLSPLFDMSSYGLRMGESYPAARVFEKLKGAAQRHNGEPT